MNLQHLLNFTSKWLFLYYSSFLWSRQDFRYDRPRHWAARCDMNRCDMSHMMIIWFEKGEILSTGIARQTVLENMDETGPNRTKMTKIWSHRSENIIYKKNRRIPKNSTRWKISYDHLKNLTKIIRFWIFLLLLQRTQNKFKIRNARTNWISK